jgi:hypothetical protein
VERDTVLGVIRSRLPRVPLEHGSVYTKFRRPLSGVERPLSCARFVTDSSATRPIVAHSGSTDTRRAVVENQCLRLFADVAGQI